jgi:hypothetical protein
MMSDSQLFQYANTTALLCWVVLMVQPRRSAPVLRFVVPAAMALLYIWALSTAPSTADGGFGSLAQVKALFSQDRAVLAGWVHYLAFDLFVGCWEVMDAQERGVRYLLVVPCLLLTFMVGPAGLLLYLIVRMASTRKLPASA